MTHEEPSFVYFEDDSLSQQVLEMILTRGIGYQTVTVFADTKDLAAKFASLPRRPDVVFLDIHIRPLDGYQTLAWIREQEDLAGCRVIAVTASVMSDEIKTLMGHGFDGGLGKPIDQMAFPDSLARILAGEAVWGV